ncbi:hypothetical protein BCR34DRAFT_596427 [Clohesyomyces aquaticus]|uniref:Uncharacterized protein n=1 Tax=Clohesyomyces aquaticus TaxID=1231657 RepID=A0A1Y2A6M4_9PLEO|nr:hypothetical protein BCR34DRAFT_596427 [Clohesyomyces aquaticus]
MQITPTDVLRFAIIASTLFLTFRLLENSLLRFVIRLVLPIAIAIVLVIVWKLCDHPVIARILGLFLYLAKKHKEVRKCQKKIKQFFSDVVCKIEKVISDLETAVSSAVAWLLGWLKSTLWVEWQRFQNKETPEEVQMRVALLVSTRSGPSYEAVLQAFTVSLSFDMLRHNSQIEWDSADATVLHRPSGKAAFARSFSVCLIPYYVWTDDTETLLDRFSCGTYWEYLGEGKHLAGDCLGWGEDRIKTIDSVLELGLCTYTNEAISRELYEPLCNTWTGYDPVWWNTLDFAIRQAWLLADNGDKRRELKDIYNNLTKQRFWGAIQTIFGTSVLPAWLEALTRSTRLRLIATLASVAVMPTLWPIALSINWIALFNLSHGLRLNWDEAAKEVESAVPQLHGLVNI